jgi:drug/metabolite transporter (DMT)-like permease
MAAFPRGVLITGSLIGAGAVFGFLGIVMALRSGIPVSVVNTIMSLAMVVPVALSVVFYHELLHVRTFAGVILAGVSVYLLQGRKS